MSEQVMNFALATRGIEVPGDIPEEWQLLLKGLLTRDPAKRWGMEQVRNWLAGRRDMTVRYEGPDIAHGAEAQRPYKLGGQEYRTAAELGKAIAENWAEGAKHLARGLLTSWVKDDVKDQDKASQLMDMVEDEKLTGEMKASLAGMVLTESVPLTWKGEIVNRDWLVGHTDDAVRILESTLPEWVQRLRGEPWLCEMRAWREKVLSRMKSAIVSYDKRLVDQMVVSSVEAIEAVAVEVAKTYVASTDSELERLLHEKSLSLEDAILLVACDRKLLLTETQRLEREIGAMAQERGIKVDDELVAKAACLEGAALQEAVSKLKAKHVNATVEALGNMLRAEALSDQDARVFLACDRAQLLTEKQDRERKVKELASKLQIKVDKRLLVEAVQLDGEQLSETWGKLCKSYIDATGGALRALLRSESLSDHEVRLLLACDRNQLLTASQIEAQQRDREEAENEERRQERQIRQAEKSANIGKIINLTGIIIGSIVVLLVASALFALLFSLMSEGKGSFATGFVVLPSIIGIIFGIIFCAGGCNDFFESINPSKGIGVLVGIAWIVGGVLLSIILGKLLF